MLRAFYDRTPPKDPFVWHQWNTIVWPVRTAEGGWTFGYVWRIRKGDVWYYMPRKEAETLDDWLSRTWP